VQRIAFIVNPTAGRGAAGRRLPEIRTAVQAQSLCEATFYTTQKRGDGFDLALEALENGADIVAAVGGDGTLHEVVNALICVPGCPANLGLIPFGTGNDFARAVGLQGSLSHFIDSIISGESHPIDIGLITSRSLPNPKHFLVAAGIGFVAQTAKTVNDGVKHLTGAAAYIVGAISTLKHFVPEYIKVTIDNKIVFEGESTLVSVSNVSTTGGGIKIVPDAQPDDGLLDVCLVSKVSRSKILMMLPRAFVGTHIMDQAVSIHRGKTIEIESISESPLWIDGEVVGSAPATFSIIPGALHMMLPKHWCASRQLK
jgi:diacylglycerol kinase (ATP)